MVIDRTVTSLTWSYSMDTVMMKFTARSAHDRSQSSEEPCEGKLCAVSRTEGIAN